ncbi:MAG: ParB N-terminal domain-containing protein [Pseudaminobacter sp.]
MTQITSIPAALIDQRSDARPLDSATIDGLTQSVQEVGLINPIRVRRLGDRYEIVSGHHRFGVCAFLGWAEIPCIVAEDDDLHAELAMIDENLMRNELSTAERADATARRKAIYEQLHPEARHGGDRSEASRQVGDLKSQSENNPVDRFTAETAAATGRSERAVQRDAERGEKVIPEVLAMVRGTKLDTGAYLDKIKKLPPSEQAQAAKRDLATANRPPAPKPKPKPKSQSRIAAQSQPGAKPTYEEMRAAILLLADLTATDMTSICPPNKRAAMCQKLAHLERVFEQVREAASA